jgi:uncharacterized protein
MNIIIYYHGRDFDGKCAGAIALKYYKQYYKNIELIPIDYGQEEKLNRTFGMNDLVVMLDWSASNTPELMKRILDTAQGFIWIDHHKTAIESMQKAYPTTTFTGIRVVGESGCELTWKYYFLDKKPMPEIVRLLGRYDVWDLKYPGGFDMLLDLQYGMKTHEWNPDDPDWELLFKDSLIMSEGLIEVGNSIKQYQKLKNKLTCESGFEVVIGGHKVFAVNSMEKSSQTFESLGDKYDIYCAFSYNGKCWDYSLYSTTVDVGEICKELGGGGHKGAAGFQSQEFILERI